MNAVEQRLDSPGTPRDVLRLVALVQVYDRLGVGVLHFAE
jgi:hypothetical protein